MSCALVLCTLAVCVCGAMTLAFAHLPIRGASVSPRRSAVDAEARAWRRLWFPMFPAFWALAVLVGWAAQEPSTTDELLRPFAFALATPLALSAVRAAFRAIRALQAASASMPVATVGILRPRVQVSSRFRAIVDGPALAAAVAHERAHARHHDPLRIWLAQVVTDLQWPSRGAVRRRQDWERSLEMARDEEARRQGARGEDLAAAIVAAAKLASPGHLSATAALTRPEIDFSLRVHRLFDRIPPRAVAARPLAAIVFFVGALAACALGFWFGDALVRALPLVTT